MSGGVGTLVSAGPLLLAIPVAAAAGAVTFLSPCVLPLVPGYLSYITGMSATAVTADAGPDQATSGQPAGMTLTARATAIPAAGSDVRTPSRSRALAGTALFVLGFSALFATYGVAFGGIGTRLLAHERGLSQFLGALLIVLGLLFAGVFDRFSFSGRIVKPSFRPRAGLASAPLLGVLFGLGWSPCIGPTLSAVLTLGLSSGTAARGALLAFVYGLGIGIPFLIVAFAVDRGVALFGFARRHARVITQVGGLLLIVVGLAEVTGAWSIAMSWLQTHWLAGYTTPI
ncbi:MAG TPA: cytochrome c biogenesis protein CcdA [Streptosporangiaceae bacterium]|nr:cytochrome c biogenesis protein CcdA [Streptosporangiaceae bacterium]